MDIGHNGSHLAFSLSPFLPVPLSQFESFQEQLAHELWIGRTFEATHHLADEKADEPLLPIEIDLHLAGMLFQHALHDRQ